MPPRGGVTATTGGKTGKGFRAKVPNSVVFDKTWKVVPPLLNFVDTTEGEYVQIISITNLAQRKQKLKILQPRTDCFRMKLSSTEGALSPGLTLKIQITCIGQPDTKSFHDQLVILHDGDDIVIPLHAYAPCPKLEFENYIDFGTCVAGTQSQRYIKFKNVGSLPGNFKIKIDPSSPYNFTPKSGTVAAGAEHEVRVDYAPNDLGPLRGTAEVEVDNAEYGVVPLEMVSTVVEQSLELTLPGQVSGSIKEIFFGSLYFGQTRVIKAWLVNNSPVPTTFQIGMKQGNSEGAVADMDDMDSDIIVIPSEGNIQPNSQMELEFVFQPRPTAEGGGEKRKGFKSQSRSIAYKKMYAETAVVEAIDSKKKFDVAFTGAAIEPLVQLSETDFNFRNCLTGERRDEYVTLTNRSEDLPINFNFSKLAHFSINPSVGRLPPMQSLKVLLSYVPRNLGKHSGNIDLVFEKSLQTLQLSVRGHAHAEGKKPAIISGTDKLPIDFKPEITFVDPTSRVPNTYRASTIEEKTQDLAGLDEKHDEAKFTYTQSEYLRRKSAHQAASDMLTTNYKARAKKEAKKWAKEAQEDPTDEVSLGMAFGSGLKSPELNLPPAMEELYLQYPMAGYAGQGKVAAKNKLKANGERVCFKPGPTTQAERRDCDAVLSYQDLKRIKRGPKAVDFGRLFLDSLGTQIFSVENSLDRHVLVELVVDSPELEKTTNLSQMIPPFETAEFDIKFQSAVVSEFKRTVAYSINKKHNYTFSCSAEVVPIALDLSREDIFFEFKPDNSKFYAEETIIISNPSNVKVGFWWTATDDVFQISPSKGSLDEYKSEKIVIRYTPKAAQKKFSSDVYLHVMNGPKKKIVCNAVLEEASFALKQKSISFGAMCVGVSQTKTIQLKNTGKFASVFQFDELPNWLKVTPKSSIVDKGCAQNLEITASSQAPADYAHTINIAYRGKKDKSPALKLNVNAQIVLPDLEILEEEINFGGVTLGNSAEKTVSLCNRSSVDITLEIELTDQPQFNLSVPKEWLTSGSSPIVESEDSQKKWFLTVKKETTLPFKLVFTPNIVDKTAFELPLILNGVDTYLPIRRVVVATGLQPKVSLSTNTIDFGNKVVLRSERAKKNPYAMTLELKNELDVEQSWKLSLPDKIVGMSDEGEEHNQIIAPNIRDEHGEVDITWRVEPVNGRLAPGQTTTVNIYFAPVHACSYEVPVSLSLGRDTKEYLKFDLLAQGTHPKLSFDRDVVKLPVVACKSQSKCTVKIFNGGYDNLDLRFNLPPEAARLPLTIDFPDGATVGLGRESVLVDFVFISPKPLSFCTYVDFIDNDGNRFPLPIIGVADNCTLTVQPYIELGRSSYKFQHKPEQPIMLSKTSEQETLTSYEESILESVPDNKNYAPASLAKLGLRALFMYLVSSGLYTLPADLDSEVEKFPAEMTSSNGKIIFDMLRQLTGKNPTKDADDKKSPTSIKKPTDTESVVENLVGDYNRMLNFMKGYGGLVNGVKAVHLLSLSHYLTRARVVGFNDYKKGTGNVSLTSQQLGECRRRAEESFPAVSREAWSTVLFQTIRIFILNRLTPKTFKTVPGIPVEQAVVNPVVFQSNIYSMAENIVLRWMTYHFQKANPHKSKRVVNFDTDLADGVVIAAIMFSHVPSLQALGAINTDPQSEEHRIFNAKKILDALREMDLIYTGLSTEDFIAPVARNLFLFSLFLFQKLPTYIPKTAILFQGSLDDSMVKYIELSNPSKKPIVYNVRLQGSSDFSVDELELTLEPKGKEGSSRKFPVYFKPRFSKSVEGRLVFTNSSGSSTNASTMVFMLKSDIISRRALHEHTIDAHCYEHVEEIIQVTNPFPEDCTFYVSCESVNAPPAFKSKKGKQAEPFALPDAIWTPMQKIKMKRGQTIDFPAHFLPFRHGDYMSQVTFLDNNHGEFVLGIIGTAKTPKPAESLKWSLQGRQSVTKDVAIPVRNGMFDDARNVCNDRISMMPKRKKNEPAPAWLENVSKKSGVIPPGNTYKVTCQNPFMVVPPSVSLSEKDENEPKETGRSGLRMRGNTANNANTLLPVVFNPKGPGLYKAEILLESAIDIRMIYVEIVVNVAMETPTLEFSAPARQTITQEIPVTNNTEEAWRIQASVSGTGFSGPNDLGIGPNEQVMYPLMFTPEWMGTITGRLDLTNAKTGDKFSYELEGTGLEPLATDHLIIECQARQTIEHKIMVQNYYNSDVMFIVESDLPNVSGDASILVPAKQIGEYTLRMNPNLAGVYNGSVSFTSSDKRFQWVAVEVNATSPHPESVIQISAPLRKATAVQISVTNPLDEVLKFEVALTGPGLYGDAFLTLGPQETGAYEFVFSPLMAGKEKGSLAFMNDKVGEFWYELDLKAEEPVAVELDKIECDIGSSKSIKVQLENPSESEIVVQSENSNPLNFSISPSILSIQPFETLEVTLTFTPSSLDEIQSSKIVFKHPKAGIWEYICTGKGVLPGPKKPITFSAPIKQRVSMNLSFRNPFEEDVTIDVALKDETGAFKLYLKKPTNLTVAALSQLQIPFTFGPKLIVNHRSSIVVTCREQGVSWTYPIQGTGEGATSAISYNIECQARKMKQEVLKLDLDGVVKGPMKRPESFKVEVIATGDDKKYEAFLRRALKVELLNPILKNGSEPLQVKALFEPLRPIEMQAMLIISKSSGGRWRFPLNLYASEPDVDDVIRVEAMINTTASVSFSITNQFNNFAEFEAYFTADSPPQFKVHPNKGILEPVNSLEGTPFLISFTPREYGKTQIGRLVIQTEHMQWTYEVRGTHPRYVPPQANASLVDNNVPSSMMERMNNSDTFERTNYLSKNMKDVKKQSHDVHVRRTKAKSPKASGVGS